MKQYPIGIQDFASIINGGFVYVDKTELVYQLASVKGVYFLSRPRRFGKSLLVSYAQVLFPRPQGPFQRTEDGGARKGLDGISCV